MGRMRMALSAGGRADTPLPQAHGCQTVQVSPLQPLLHKIRPPSVTLKATYVDGI